MRAGEHGKVWSGCYAPQNEYVHTDYMYFKLETNKRHYIESM